jgi:pilus assembly protein CpaB
LQKGERAITIPVNTVSGLSGMIKPNDRVDIVGTFSVGSKIITRILNQNVTVIAVGSRFGNNSEENYGSVTLKVSPEEAEILTFAERHGDLRLLLRNRRDLEIQGALPEVDFGNILTE